MLVMLCRYYHRIGDDIIKIGCAEAAGKAKETDLNGRRPVRKNPAAAMARETHEIDRNIDFAVAYVRRVVEIAHVRDIHKPIERSFEAFAQRRFFRWTEGNGDHLKPAAVMAGKYRRHQTANGRIAEIARYIGNSYPLMLKGAAVAQCGSGGRAFMPYP